jgi:conjugal transfer/entry exclusion protein
MSDLKKAIAFVERQIEELEKTEYMYTNIITPRAQADLKILNNLREQHLKMSALQEKVATGQEVTAEDVYNSVPASFR